MPNLEAWRPKFLSVLRILTALLFMEHGLMKLLQFPGPQPGVPHPLPAILVAAAWIEIVGGVLIALGLFTRLTAFICSGEMAIGYFMIHAPQGFYPALNGGEAAVLYCFVFLYFVFAGGGEWSLDALMRKRA